MEYLKKFQSHEFNKRQQHLDKDNSVELKQKH